MPERELLTKREVAELLRVSLATVDRMMSAGDLKFIKWNKRVLFRRKDLDAFLRKHLVKK